MTQSPLEPLILRLAVPAIVSNLVTVTYNMADTWFIGRLGTSQSGAVGVAFSVMTIMQAIGFFFGQGGGNSLSRELGKRNEERASRLLSVAFFGSVGFGVLLGVLGLLVLHPLVRGLGATDTIAPYAVQYLTPLLVATPCVTGSFTMNGLLRFQGLSAYSMIGLVTGAILNIALAPALIFGAGLGIFGAGLATAICQTISFTILTVMCVKVGVVRLSPRWFQPDMLLIREMIGGGLPSLLRNGVGSVAVTCVNLAANPFGDAAIAAMAIVNRIALTANSMIVGFGQGFQPVCGYNYGAGLFARVRRGFWFGVRVETAILVCATVVFALFAPRTGRPVPGRPRRDPDRRGGVAAAVLHAVDERVQHDVEYEPADHGQDVGGLDPGCGPSGAVPGAAGLAAAGDPAGVRPAGAAGHPDGPADLRPADVRDHGADPVPHAAGAQGRGRQSRRHAGAVRRHVVVVDRQENLIAEA